MSRVMAIGLEKTKKVLNVMTQNGVCTAVHNIHRCYCIDHLNLQHNILGVKWFVDWIPDKTKSITQCTGSWVYTNGSFIEVHPKEHNQSITASETLQDFYDETGTP